MNKKELKNYENLTILITGADGFVASHLCEHMISQKANVIGLVKRNSGGIFKNLDNIKNKMKIKWGDTQDPSIIEEIFVIVPAFGATTKQEDAVDISSIATLSTYVFNSAAVAVTVVPPIDNEPGIATVSLAVPNTT